MKTDVYQHPGIWLTLWVNAHSRTMIHGCFVMAVTNLTLITLHCSAWTTSKKILSRWISYDSSTFTAKKCLLSSWNYTLKSVTRWNRKASRNSLHLKSATSFCQSHIVEKLCTAVIYPPTRGAQSHLTCNIFFLNVEFDGKNSN